MSSQKFKIYILLTLSLISLSSVSFAAESPTSKGAYRLSGGGSFTSYTYSDTSGEYKDYRMSLSYSHFVIDDLSIGAIASYIKSKSSTSESTTKSLGPLIRWYFPVETKIFIEGSYVFGESDYGCKSKTRAWGATAGMDFFISKNVAIEPYISYQKYKDEAQCGNPSTAYNFDLETTSIGVAITAFIF